MALDDRIDGGSRPRVLVADEDAGIIRLLHAVLAGDFEITVAHNGREAVELAASAAPDLVMLDLGMPILDGFTACRLIRAADDTLPIVILSGRTDEASLRDAFEAGATDYLTKPFTVSQLRSRLRANLLRAQ
jgi:two-component system KDP operon response regulator KdpE